MKQKHTIGRILRFVVLGSSLIASAIATASNPPWSVSFHGDTQYASAVSFEGMHVLRDGSTYVVGAITNSVTGNDWLLAKVDYLGNIVWQKTVTNVTFSNDAPTTSAVSSDGGLLVGGYLGDNSFGKSDWCIVKYDTLGNELWRVTFTGDATSNLQSAPVKILSDGAGGAYATGVLGNDLSGKDWLTVRISKTGTVLWQHQYASAGSANDIPDGMVRTAYGVVVTGRSNLQPAAIAYKGNGSVLGQIISAVPDISYLTTKPPVGLKNQVFTAASATFSTHNDGDVIVDSYTMTATSFLQSYETVLAPSTTVVPIAPLPLGIDVVSSLAVNKLGQVVVAALQSDQVSGTRNVLHMIQLSTTGALTNSYVGTINGGGPLAANFCGYYRDGSIYVLNSRDDNPMNLTPFAMKFTSTLGLVWEHGFPQDGTESLFPSAARLAYSTELLFSETFQVAGTEYWATVALDSTGKQIFNYESTGELNYSRPVDSQYRTTTGHRPAVWVLGAETTSAYGVVPTLKRYER